MKISNLNNVIDLAVKTKEVPLISAIHGIGKSQSIMQYAEKNDYHCEQLILSLMDTGDLLGIPVTKEYGSEVYTAWAAPSWYNRILNNAFPQKLEISYLIYEDDIFELKSIVEQESVNNKIDRSKLVQLYCNFVGKYESLGNFLQDNKIRYSKGRNSILFLDEFNRAPSDILNATLQLILDKRLNDHVLPANTVIIAAINPDDGSYHVGSLDPALLNRFIFIEVEPDLESWIDYARKANINEVVIDFLIEHKDYFVYIPKTEDVTATPRSWEKLSKILDKVDPKIEYTVFKGLVGSAPASTFIRFKLEYDKQFKFKPIDKFINDQLKKHEYKEVIEQVKRKYINKMESIQISKIGRDFYEKYINLDDVEKKIPLIVWLHSMPLELAAAFLTRVKEDDPYINKLHEIWQHLADYSLLTAIINNANK